MAEVLVEEGAAGSGGKVNYVLLRVALGLGVVVGHGLDGIAGNVVHVHGEFLGLDGELGGCE